MAFQLFQFAQGWRIQQGDGFFPGFVYSDLSATARQGKLQRGLGIPAELHRGFAGEGALGVCATPVDGAALVFKVDDRAKVEGFVGKDPYAVNGLVTGWRIREWTVVVGTAL